MKKFLMMMAMLAVLAGCHKPDPVKPKTDVSGIWELTNVSTKAASIGSVSVSVYLNLDAAGTFSLYQKIGEGRYTAFTGSWLLADDDTLSGTYDGGKAWGPYAASVSGNTLTLVSAGGKEVDTYTKVSSIPSAVTDNLY